jgi:hypothetical protein
VKLFKATDTIRNTFVLPWWKKNVRRSFVVWFKTTYRTKVNLNPPKLASWGKYWSKFNGCLRWKYFWTAIQKGVICDVGNLKMYCQEVARNEIQLRR